MWLSKNTVVRATSWDELAGLLCTLEEWHGLSMLTEFKGFHINDEVQEKLIETPILDLRLHLPKITLKPVF